MDIKGMVRTYARPYPAKIPITNRSLTWATKCRRCIVRISTAGVASLNTHTHSLILLHWKYMINNALFLCSIKLNVFDRDRCINISPHLLGSRPKTTKSRLGVFRSCYRQSPGAGVFYVGSRDQFNKRIYQIALLLPKRSDSIWWFEWYRLAIGIVLRTSSIQALDWQAQ